MRALREVFAASCLKRTRYLENLNTVGKVNFKVARVVNSHWEMSVNNHFDTKISILGLVFIFKKGAC